MLLHFRFGFVLPYCCLLLRRAAMASRASPHSIVMPKLLNKCHKHLQMQFRQLALCVGLANALYIFDSYDSSDIPPDLKSTSKSILFSYTNTCVGRILLLPLSSGCTTCNNFEQLFYDFEHPPLQSTTTISTTMCDQCALFLLLPINHA